MRPGEKLEPLDLRWRHGGPRNKSGETKKKIGSREDAEARRAVYGAVRADVSLRARQSGARLAHRRAGRRRRPRPRRIRATVTGVKGWAS